MKVKDTKHQKNHSSTKSKYSKSHISSFGSFHHGFGLWLGLFFGDYANCHENVILAAFCVNTCDAGLYLAKRHIERAKQRGNNVRITCGNARNLHQTLAEQRRRRERSRMMKCISSFYTVSLCTSRKLANLWYRYVLTNAKKNGSTSEELWLE